MPRDGKASTSVPDWHTPTSLSSNYGRTDSGRTGVSTKYVARVLGKLDDGFVQVHDADEDRRGEGRDVLHRDNFCAAMKVFYY